MICTCDCSLCCDLRPVSATVCTSGRRRSSEPLSNPKHTGAPSQMRRHCVSVEFCQNGPLLCTPVSYNWEGGICHEALLHKLLCAHLPRPVCTRWSPGSAVWSQPPEDPQSHHSQTRSAYLPCRRRSHSCRRAHHQRCPDPACSRRGLVVTVLGSSPASSWVGRLSSRLAWVAVCSATMLRVVHAMNRGVCASCEPPTASARTGPQCTVGVLLGPTGVMTHPSRMMSHQSANSCSWCCRVVVVVECRFAKFVTSTSHHSSILCENTHCVWNRLLLFAKILRC